MKEKQPASQPANQPAADPPGNPELGEPAAGPPADRIGQLAGLVFGAAIALVVLWLLTAGSGQRPAAGRVIGGSPVKVLFTDTGLGREYEGTLAGDEYRVSLPARAKEPAVEIYGEGPGSPLVIIPRLDQLEGFSGGGELTLPPVGIWSAPLRLRIDGEELVFDWPPPPQGEGWPLERRYAIQFEYKKLSGRIAETSLVTFDPRAGGGREKVTLTSLSELMPQRDPEQPIQVQVRVHDRDRLNSPQWIGFRGEWTFGEPEVKGLGSP